VAHLKLKLQVFCGDEVALGPGKAALLEAVAREGSISAAARALGMSYRRGWLLVDQMNRCFVAPLVATQAGGGSKAGARLTEAGEAALSAYRALSAEVEQAAGGEPYAMLAGALRDTPMARQDAPGGSVAVHPATS
jgi:molybdate transport system regulatory protein